MYDTDPQLRTDVDGLPIESVDSEVGNASPSTVGSDIVSNGSHIYPVQFAWCLQVVRPRAHLEHGAQLVNGVRATFRLVRDPVQLRLA